MPVKKNISVKKTGININIKNENHQQSKNKYVKPPPKLNQNVPTAYQPYNPVNTPLWNDPRMAEIMERKGYQRAIRPLPQPVGNRVRPQPVGDGVRLGNRLGEGHIMIDRFLEDGMSAVEDEEAEPERRVVPFINDDMDDEDWDGRKTTISPPASANPWDEGDRIVGKIKQNMKVQDLDRSFAPDAQDADDENVAAGAPAPQRRGPGRPDIIETERELTRIQLDKINPEVSGLLKENEFIEMYEKATEDPHNCLVVDNHPLTDRDNRFKINFDQIIKIKSFNNNKEDE